MFIFDTPFDIAQCFTRLAEEPGYVTSGSARDGTAYITEGGPVQPFVPLPLQQDKYYSQGDIVGDDVTAGHGSDGDCCTRETLRRVPLWRGENRDFKMKNDKI